MLTWPSFIGRVPVYVRRLVIVGGFLATVAAGVISQFGGSFLYDLYKDASGPSHPLTAAAPSAQPAERAESKSAIDRSVQKPTRIEGRPESIEFFDRASGDPRVWYHQGAQGSVELFDSPGFHPDSGALLLPVSKSIVDQIKSQSQELAAKTAEQERIVSVAKKKAALGALFGNDVHPDGITLIGVKPRDGSKASRDAARAIAAAFLGEFDRQGRPIAEVPNALYESPYFDELMNGGPETINASDIGWKIRIAFFVTAHAACRAATTVAGITTCVVEMRLRAISATGQTILLQDWSATGAGANEQEAIKRSIEHILGQNSARITRL